MLHNVSLTQDGSKPRSISPPVDQPLKRIKDISPQDLCFPHLIMIRRKLTDQLIRDIFGSVKPDGNRQFRTAFVEIYKKVGKSELAAAIALHLLYADNEPSAEVYGAAADRQQASIVFDVERQMVEMSPAHMKRSKLMSATKQIVNIDHQLQRTSDMRYIIETTKTDAESHASCLPPYLLQQHGPRWHE